MRIERLSSRRARGEAGRESCRQTLGLSLLHESRRRHGMEKRIDGRGTFTELASEAKTQLLGSKKDGDGARAEVGSGRSEEEERLRALRGKRPSNREG